MATRSLATRLRAARALLQQHRDSLYDSHMVRAPGPTQGTVDEPHIERELARFDAAAAALTEAIDAAKGVR